MKPYLTVLRDILDNGEDRETRSGPVRTSFSHMMRFDLEEGFPAMTTKRLAFKQVAAELLWFLIGSPYVQALQDMGCHIWDANVADYEKRGLAKFDGDTGRIYGSQWRDWGEGGIDQIANLVTRLREDPFSRYHVVTAWNPDDLNAMCLPACHIFFQAFVSKDGRLSLHMHQRSCDMFLGVPFNIASYALLTHMLAHVTGLRVGALTHVLGDAHIYHNHFDQVRIQLSRDCRPLPKLEIAAPSGTSIDSFKLTDFKLVDYDPHPTIKGEMSV